MTKSPLEFAQAFAKLKSRVAEATAAEQRLLLLLEFGPQLRQILKVSSYGSFVEEYLSLLFAHISDSSLLDLSIVELEQLCDLLQEIPQSQDSAAALRRSGKRLAEVYFYVGETNLGLRAAAGACGLEVELLKRPPDQAPSEGGDTRQSAFAEARRQVEGRSAALDILLAEIADDWEAIHDSYYFDRVNCLFVEKDVNGSRGRLRKVTGNVEARKNQSQTDDIAFDNKVRSPDDPFVGVAYESLAAVRAILDSFRGSPPSRGQGSGSEILARRGSRNPTIRYHAHFNIENSDHDFTGDSIGLALALLSFAQLLKPEMLRLERFVSGEVACTGGVDATGRITPVNDATLPAKIERAFFSPLRYLVLPQSNFTTAQNMIERLSAAYPHRTLKLIGADHLAEVIEDHNVVRSEKMCFGEFVTKRAYKYTRSLRVQIPMLIVLLAIFGALIAEIFPKWMPWFDWNPKYGEIRENSLEIFNAGGDHLWSLSTTGMRHLPAPEDMFEPKEAWNLRISDLDNDGKNEVVYCPWGKTDQARAPSIYILDSKGSVIARDSLRVFTKYPGDVASCGYPVNVDYSLSRLFIYSRRPNDDKIVVSATQASNPIRCQIEFRNSRGAVIGRVLHQGGLTRTAAVDYNKDGVNELMFGSINNRLERVALWSITPESVSGVLPPFDCEQFICSGMSRADFSLYLTFPPDICTKDPLMEGITDITLQEDGVLVVSIGRELGCYRLFHLDSSLMPISMQYGDDSAEFRKLYSVANPTFDWEAHSDSMCASINRY